MKKIRFVKVNSLFLIKLRNDLRIILIEAYFKKLDEFDKKLGKLLYPEELQTGNIPSIKFSVEADRIQRARDDFYQILYISVCICSFCMNSNKNMVIVDYGKHKGFFCV